MAGGGCSGRGRCGLPEGCPPLPQPPRLGWDRFLSSSSQHPARLLPCQPPSPPAPPSFSCPFPFLPPPSSGRRSRGRKASLNSQVSATGQRRPRDRGGGGALSSAAPARVRGGQGAAAVRPPLPGPPRGEPCPGQVRLQNSLSLLLLLLLPPTHPPAGTRRPSEQR